jgi:hypothetical protein
MSVPESASTPVAAGAVWLAGLFSTPFSMSFQSKA